MKSGIASLIDILKALLKLKIHIHYPNFFPKSSLVPGAKVKLYFSMIFRITSAGMAAPPQAIALNDERSNFSIPVAFISSIIPGGTTTAAAIWRVEKFTLATMERLSCEGVTAVKDLMFSTISKKADIVRR